MVSKDPITSRELIVSSGLMLIAIGVAFFVLFNPSTGSINWGFRSTFYVPSFIVILSDTWVCFVVAGIGAALLIIGARLKSNSR